MTNRSINSFLRPAPAVGAFKRLASAMLLALLAGTATAQSGAGNASGSAPAEKFGCRNPAPGSMATEKGASCMPVGRSGDPFVFCTEGVPDHCWVAVDPLSGTWEPICYYVNYMWTSTFSQICPRAMSMGHWQGQGAPSMTPFMH